MTDCRTSTFLPLLAAQRQQWTSHHDDPSNPRYNCGGYFRLTGGIDQVALRAAVTAAYSEADMLRVRLAEVDGHPRQTVVEGGPAPLSSVALPDEQAAVEWMRSALTVPFDLRNGDQMCSHALIEVDSGEEFFFFLYHHIVLDAYGAHQYLARVAQYYNSFVAGTATPKSGFARLEQLVAEERAYRSSARARRDDAYWRDVLATPLPWSALAPQEAPAQPRPLRSVVRVPDRTWSAFQELSAHTGTRWPVVVQAVVACLLSEVTGSADIVIGMLAANRATHAAVKTPTNMANELPLRVDVDMNGTFIDLLDQVARRVGEATTHQRAHLDRQNTPISLRTFANVIAFGEQPRFRGCASEFHVLATGPASNFRVNCYGGLTGDHLLEYEVNPCIYDENALTGHQERLSDLLLDLVSSPDVRLSDTLTARTR